MNSVTSAAFKTVDHRIPLPFRLVWILPDLHVASCLSKHSYHDFRRESFTWSWTQSIALYLSDSHLTLTLCGLLSLLLHPKMIWSGSGFSSHPDIISLHLRCLLGLRSHSPQVLVRGLKYNYLLHTSLHSLGIRETVDVKPEKNTGEVGRENCRSQWPMAMRFKGQSRKQDFRVIYVLLLYNY